ncbi:hypothetical protein NH340_JMT07439 [Sarcoptes scabiei]|nr:hypothetical protein NH340_JMT07439 [Sarcoptes scabiei]
MKETENLIIKNRRLNVSPAVMKHQNYHPKPRIHEGNGSYINNQLNFSNAANYNHLYYDNSIPNYCTAEGQPLYQVARTINGQYVSGCPPLLASPAPHFLSRPPGPPPPTAATSYLNGSFQSPMTSSHVYGAHSSSSIHPHQQSISTQHLLFHQPASQHLPINNCPTNSAQFNYQYSIPNCNPALQSNTNGFLYSLVTNNSSQMNNLNNQAYYQYALPNSGIPSASTAAVNQSMNEMNAITNKTVAASKMVPISELQALSIQSKQNYPSFIANQSQSSTIYPSYHSNLVAGNSNNIPSPTGNFQLNANSSNAFNNFKSDSSSIEPNSLINQSMGSVVSNGTASGFMPLVSNEIWPSNNVSHSNMSAYPTKTIAVVPPSSNIKTSSVAKNQSSDRLSNSVHQYSSNPKNCNNGSGNNSTNQSKSNHHLYNDSAVLSFNPKNSHHKDKYSTQRNNPSSYNSSHSRKMYNGQHSNTKNLRTINFNNSHYNNNGNNHGHHSDKTRHHQIDNKSLSNNDQIDTNYHTAESRFRHHHSKNFQNSGQMHPSRASRSQRESSSSSNSASSNVLNPNFITKTINGVQIYALAARSDLNSDHSNSLETRMSSLLPSPPSISSQSSSSTPSSNHNSIPVNNINNLVCNNR